MLQAEIAFSSVTADNLLRAPVYKGIREDLLEIPERRPLQRTHNATPRVPKENILQLQISMAYLLVFENFVLRMNYEK